MKKFFVMAAMVLLAASCSNESVENIVENNAEPAVAPVRISVNDFSVSLEEFAGARGLTRAVENPADFFKEKAAITLAFYDAGGTEVYKTTQLKSDGSTYTTFGEFSCNLPIGTYTMVAVAYAFFDGDVFSLTSPTEAAFTSERPRETFCRTQSVTVTTSGAELAVTLKRISSWLCIESTDNRPSGITKIRTTYAKGGKSFNPSTGLTLSDAGFTLTNTPSSAVGSTIKVSSYPFLTSADDAEEVMNITIEVLDASDNVLFTHTVEDVPFKRNRKTTLRGALFTASASSAAFQLETSWLAAAEAIDF